MNNTTNPTLLQKLRLGPKRMMMESIWRLHDRLTKGALQATTLHFAKEFRLSVPKNEAMSHELDLALLAILRECPDETREALQRVFEGFRLMFQENEQCAKWTLSWDPQFVSPKNPDERVLVDFTRKDVERN